MENFNIPVWKACSILNMEEPKLSQMRFDGGGPEFRQKCKGARVYYNKENLEKFRGIIKFEKEFEKAKSLVLYKNLMELIEKSGGVESFALKISTTPISVQKWVDKEARPGQTSRNLIYVKFLTNV